MPRVVRVPTDDERRDAFTMDVDDFCKKYSASKSFFRLCGKPVDFVPKKRVRKVQETPRKRARFDTPVLDQPPPFIPQDVENIPEMPLPPVTPPATTSTPPPSPHHPPAPVDERDEPAKTTVFRFKASSSSSGSSVAEARGHSIKPADVADEPSDDEHRAALAKLHMYYLLFGEIIFGSREDRDAAKIALRHMSKETAVQTLADMSALVSSHNSFAMYKKTYITCMGLIENMGKMVGCKLDGLAFMMSTNPDVDPIIKQLIIEYYAEMTQYLTPFNRLVAITANGLVECHEINRGVHVQ